ncbi:MAG: polysaccharide biosynthesis C-terminal domain-containing protein, partial [Ignavibacteriaceae bacterium]
MKFVFGAAYAAGGASLTVLLITMIVDYPGGVIGVAIFAYDRQKVLINASIIGGVSNVLFDLLLIPRFGITGSAFATLIAQTLNNAYLWYEMKKINNFLFIGLNSIAEYSKVSNPFASNGIIELSQLNIISEILEQYQDEKYRKIVLVHHHFNKMNIPQNSPGSFWQKIEKQTMKLRKKKRLLKIFKHFGVELVLHGHYHVSKDYVRKGIIFSNAGASLKGPEKGEMNINIIDIGKRDIDIEIVNITVDKWVTDQKDLFYKDLIADETLELETA